MMMIHTFSLSSFQLLMKNTTTVTQKFSHRLIKCQSRSWPQRDTEIDGWHHDDNPLLRLTGIQIATKPLPGLTDREYRKLIGVKTTPLGMNYSFYCLEHDHYFNLNYKLQRILSDVLCPIQQCHKKSDTRSFLAFGGLHQDKLIMRHFTSNGTDQCQNGPS